MLIPWGLVAVLTSPCIPCEGLGGWNVNSGRPQRRAPLSLKDETFTKCYCCGGLGYHRDDPSIRDVPDPKPS